MCVIYQHVPWGISFRQAHLLDITVWWSSKWVTHVTCTTSSKSLVTIVALLSQVTMPLAAVVHSSAGEWFTTRAGVAGSVVHDKRELGFEEAVQESERRRLLTLINTPPHSSGRTGRSLELPHWMVSLKDTQTGKVQCVQQIKLEPRVCVFILPVVHNQFNVKQKWTTIVSTRH